MSDTLGGDLRAGRVDPVTGVFHSRVQPTTLSSTFRVVQESDGITLAPLALIEAELKTGALTIIDTVATGLRLNMGFIYPAGRRYGG